MARTMLVRAARAIGLALACALGREAFDIYETYTGPNDGLWSVGTNWSLGVPPDDAPVPPPPGVYFHITVPTGKSVKQDAADCQVTDLSIQNEGTIKPQPGSSLTVVNPAMLGGIINAAGGNFTVLAAGTTLDDRTDPLNPIYRARVYASAGSQVRIGATEYKSWGIWDSWDADWPSGDQSGTWSPVLMSAAGAGTVLDLSSVTTFDAGFTSAGIDHTYQQVTASGGGVIDLSGVTLVRTPASGRDRLDFTAAGGTILLSSLQVIRTPGSSPFEVTVSGGGLLAMGNVHLRADTTFSVDDGTLRLGGLRSLHPTSITLAKATDRLEVARSLELGTNVALTSVTGVSPDTTPDPTPLSGRGRSRSRGRASTRS